jgi:hypothetical protein
VKQQRPVESTDDFKLRIAGIVGDKSEHIAEARRSHPMLVRKPTATKALREKRGTKK